MDIKLNAVIETRSLQEIRSDFIAAKILPTVWLGDNVSRIDDYTRLAENCDEILECGVYTGLTTTAFLLARPKKLVSIDTTSKYFSLLADLSRLAKNQGTEFTFLEMNDLDYESEGQDLLLIDTTHFYDQTLKELDRFGPNTRKRIILHDCASHEGVFQAVSEWLWCNKNFYIAEHDNRGDGLCVLERY
ncbi:hypothetical protein [uncultured Rhodoblastus sp.]|uniref:hypothetical protein n=1 Tax=uncultured Rhodoblastus sp. TaxID=543037 RepID=UPI0025F47BE0|nr:hypothetical protein [uncultured Rhodoblastus sp.]